MQKIYDAYVQQCLQLCLKDDYGDRKKLRAHNCAMKRIADLEVLIREMDCEEIVLRMLNHEDERVKLNAATFCLKERIHVEKADQILKAIMEHSTDGTLSLSAKMVLQTKR